MSTSEIRFGLAVAARVAVVWLATLTAAAKPAPTGRQWVFFPLPPSKPRLQFVSWFSGEEQVVRKSRFKTFLLGKDSQRRTDTLLKPYGIAARDGVVYVCDTYAATLLRLDFVRHTCTRLGDRGPGRLRKPLNVAIDAAGYIFVADGLREQVVVFAPDGRVAAAFDLPSPAHPVDVAIHGDELFVLDNHRENSRVLVLDRSSGKVLRQFGKTGAGECEFRFPSSLAVSPDGFLYVADTMNFRLHKLTLQGRSVWVKGEAGTHLGQFSRPRGVRVGPDGVVYVVDGLLEVVQMFNADGDLLMPLGGPGDTDGALNVPAQVAIDTTSVRYFAKGFHKDFRVDYLLFATNQMGPRAVNVYAFGSFPDGYRFTTGLFGTVPSLAGEASGGSLPPLPAAEADTNP